MGKRLNGKALLDEIGKERAALDATLARLTKAEMTEAGVTKGGWSVKDILAHLVEWQQMSLDWYAAGLLGEVPALPAPGYTWRQVPQLNAMIQKKHERRSLAVVTREYESFHQRIVDLIATLADPDLVTAGRYAWTGPSWTLSDYFRATTASHYSWARTRIRRWHNAKSKPGAAVQTKAPARKKAARKATSIR